MSKDEVMPEVVEAPVEAQSVEDPGYVIVDVVGLPGSASVQPPQGVDPRKGHGAGRRV